MKNIYLNISEQDPVHSPLVLATVTRSKGSTPQKPGSSALIGKDGLIVGTVGGGIVEGEVLRIAAEAIANKKSGHYHFNLANDISKSNEAICGGEISVLIDAGIQNSISVFEQIKESIDNHIRGVLITMVTAFSEDRVLINRYWMSGSVKPEIPFLFNEIIDPVVSGLLNGTDKSAYRELELSLPDEEPSSLFFLEPVFPPPQLIIAGAGHIGRALSDLGRMVGFEVTVIDDRPEYANALNLPAASNIIVKDIGEAMLGIEKNQDTYVVIVTRCHKDDAAALKPCIGADLAYTGMIGSKKKIAAIKADSIAKGWASQGQWKNIFAPIGLDIRSQTVEEIAISIAAQLVLVRNTNFAEKNTLFKKD